MVDCNASGSGFGAVLHQGAGPLAFFSRPFAPRHAKLATYERELIGLVQAVRHWRPYLWGQQFVVRTDHYSLKFLLDQRLSTIPQHHWISKLFGFDFTVEFRPGHLNTVADALSRHDAEEISLAAISRPTFQLYDDIRHDVMANDDTRHLRDKILAGEMGEPWRVADGLVLHGRRVFVAATSALVPTLLQLAHGAGHEGIQKTLVCFRADFFIHHDRALVRDFVRTCTTCQRNKTEMLHPAGLL